MRRPIAVLHVTAMQERSGATGAFARLVLVAMTDNAWFPRPPFRSRPSKSTSLRSTRPRPWGCSGRRATPNSATPSRSSKQGRATSRARSSFTPRRCATDASTTCSTRTTGPLAEPAVDPERDNGAHGSPGGSPVLLPHAPVDEGGDPGLVGPGPLARDVTDEHRERHRPTRPPRYYRDERTEYPRDRSKDTSNTDDNHDRNGNGDDHAVRESRSMGKCIVCPLGKVVDGRHSRRTARRRVGTGVIRRPLRLSQATRILAWTPSRARKRAKTLSRGTARRLA